MKKLVLVLAIVFAGIMSANAQVWIGGGLGAQVEKNYTGFSIAPEVGYSINNHWQVALGLSFDYKKGTPANSISEVKNNKELTFQPYVRYVGGTIGHKFSLFVDLCGDFGLLDRKGDFAVTLQPGIAWAATERFTAAFRFATIGYDHGIYGADGFLLKGALSCPSVGIYYTL